jgi:cardiolipin synthase
MAEPVFTVANQLTMLRMAFVPLLVLLALGGQFTWALVVFVVAGLTDVLDGYIARHGHQVTQLGATLDPIADKIMVGSTYAVLTWSSAVFCAMPIWLTVTLLFRDTMTVVGVLAVNLTVGPRVFYPSRFGKASSALNMVTGGAALAVNAAGDCLPALRWLYVATLVVLIASTAQYVYSASERPPKKGSPRSD